MKKKFNFYCILLVVAFISTTILNYETYFQDFVRGFNEGNAAWQKTDDAQPYNPDYSYKLALVPNDYQQTTDSLVNTQNGQPIHVNIYSAEAYAPDFTTPSDVRWCSFFEYLFGIIAALLMFPSFIMIIITINQGKIFTNRLSLLLNLLGISLIAYFFCALFDSYGDYLICITNLALENYTIRKPSGADEVILFFGIGLLAMAQVIKIGKQMKEEQELTI